MSDYSREDLRILNEPISYIRSNPSKFLDGLSKPTNQILSVKMFSTIIYLSSFPIKLDVSSSWWIISCEKDWMKGDSNLAVLEYFEKLIPLPSAGRNSYRAEILLGAYADAVVTKGKDGILWIKGADKYVPPSDFDVVNSSPGRFIAFFVLEE